MPGDPLPMDPIDMAGSRFLLVMAHRSEGPSAGPGAVALRVLDTDDKKYWVVKDPAIVLYAGDSVVTEVGVTRRFARLNAEALPGAGEASISIRVVRVAQTGDAGLAS